MQNTLQFRINLMFILLMIALAATIVVVIQTIGKSLIIAENYKYIEQKGRTIVAQLSQRIRYAEAMGKSLSNIAETLPKNEALFKQLIPKLLYEKKAHIIVAGGGIWPEPYTFDPDKERRSFFWGHGEGGEITYFDDYNKPGGPGYHFEEWYVPGRFLNTNQIYWSRSYVDPYSNEPMVTCTTPYYANGKFSGVSTIDLRLDDLKKFFDKEAKALNGYIFAVDRNNKFLSFPDTRLVTNQSNSSRSIGINEFITVNDLAVKTPQFYFVAEALSKINNQVLSLNLTRTGFKNELAKKISEQSYQIDMEEARLITASLKAENNESAVDQFVNVSIEKDFLLKEPAEAFIFLIPQTCWKIVIVSSEKQITQVAHSISSRIFLFLTIGILVCVFITYMYNRAVFILPLNKMTRCLIQATKNADEGLIELPAKNKNELGNLAYWFNRRTEELRELNEKLNREILSRKKSQKALKESEQRLYVHLQNTPVGAVSWDMNFLVTEWNPSAENIFGYTKKEALGRHIADLILPEEISNLVERIFADLIARRGGERSVNENVTKNGKRILCDWYNTALKDTEGNIVGVASLVNDITEQKRTQELMAQSEKMMSIGGLAAGMAHEINNPLAGMIQNAQVIYNRLTKNLPVNEKTAKSLGTSMQVIEQFMKDRGILDQLELIRSGGIRAAKIIENMLSFAKKGGAQRNENNLVDLIEDTLAIAANEYSLKKEFDFRTIEIVRRFNPDVPPIFCERSKIQQVLFNILKNASEAMCENKNRTPKIIIRLSKKMNMACIEIEDNGPGIEEEVQKRIFEPFFTTKSTDKGTGLGLSVSYFIVVDNHKGEMAVESTVGKGTKFIIKLPFREAD